MNDRRKPDPPRPKPEPARHVTGREADTRHDARYEDDQDQGILQDERAQDQPADRERARKNR